MGTATSSVVATEPEAAPGTDTSAPAVDTPTPGTEKAVAGSLNPNRQERRPFTGWRKRQGEAVHDKLVDDVVTASITEEELVVFYKKHGQILRGVKQRQQLDTLLALKENSTLTLTGWNKDTGAVLETVPQPTEPTT